jgi:hypothetical protein
MAHEIAVIAHEMIRGKHRHAYIGGGFGQSQKGIQNCGGRSSVLGLNHQVLREYPLEQIAVMAFVRVGDHGQNPILSDCQRNA